MIKYQIRSRELLDVANEIKTGRLIISPYFQRDLVWRELHKIDFINTILLGFPFPQIFISRGKIDVDTMTSTSCVVDGQQRMNAIMGFLKDEFSIAGKKYSEFTPTEKEKFLKYEIPIIDLDLAEDDPQIIQIFQRLNRTFYSLSKIEKLATEYAPSEFMFVAKFLSKQLVLEEENALTIDPNVPPSFYDWAKSKKISYFHKWLIDGDIFSNYELSRKVHLQFVLNLMATVMGGFFNRNDLSERYLSDFSESFVRKDEIVKKLEDSAQIFNRFRFPKKSYWLNKSNAFSLIIVIAKHLDSLDESKLLIIKESLIEFERDVSPDYALAAKEGVNNTKERSIRDAELTSLFLHAM
ncbi:DUF262 domain-containing protein [Undibacterium sp. TJN19]|uniref:DUF262 domain-containing protein n=1 Tax=Undibacterium sp. TJN19 TaxID=3413055 RepID=UPI003BF40EFD